MPVSGIGVGGVGVTRSVTLGQYGLEGDLVSGSPGTLGSELFYLDVT